MTADSLADYFPPVRISKGQAQAWRSHDILAEALAQYWHELSTRPPGSRLSPEQVNALASLSAQLEAWQERIRIHRRQPLPGTARPRPANPSKTSRPTRRAEALAPPELGDQAGDQAAEAGDVDQAGGGVADRRRPRAEDLEPIADVDDRIAPEPFE